MAKKPSVKQIVAAMVVAKKPAKATAKPPKKAAPAKKPITAKKGKLPPEPMDPSMMDDMMGGAPSPFGLPMPFGKKKGR